MNKPSYPLVDRISDWQCSSWSRNVSLISSSSWPRSTPCSSSPTPSARLAGSSQSSTSDPSKVRCCEARFMSHYVAMHVSVCIYFAYILQDMLVDLGWVDFDLGVPPCCPAAQPLLPNSHQPRQNWADGGTLKIQVNLT